MAYITTGVIPSELIENKNIRKINCQEYSLKEIEEIVLQTNLFQKKQFFILENFSIILETLHHSKIIEFLEKIKNSNTIINLTGGINLIKDQKIKSYFQQNFKIIDSTKLIPNQESIEKFITFIKNKYNIENYTKLYKIVNITLKKTNYDFLTTERVIDDIFFKYPDIEKLLETGEVNEEIIEFFVLQYKESNLFNIVNLFLEILFRKDKFTFAKNYELFLNYLDEIEINGKMEELWGLIFSQIVAVVKIHHEYTKIGENLKNISNTLKINYYRVLMLIKFVRNLDYLIKYKDFKKERIFSIILESEIKIKTNQSTYRQEIEKILQIFSE